MNFSSAFLICVTIFRTVIQSFPKEDEGKFSRTFRGHSSCWTWMPKGDGLPASFFHRPATPLVTDSVLPASTLSKITQLRNFGPACYGSFLGSNSEKQSSGQHTIARQKNINTPKNMTRPCKFWHHIR
jgi:hypothetical protein